MAPDLDDLKPEELTDPSMAQELTVTLTRAQLMLIESFLAENIQPKGYDMIAFAYDLFTRLKEALAQPAAEEPFGGISNE